MEDALPVHDEAEVPAGAVEREPPAGEARDQGGREQDRCPTVSPRNSGLCTISFSF